MIFLAYDGVGVTLTVASRILYAHFAPRVIISYLQRAKTLEWMPSSLSVTVVAKRFTRSRNSTQFLKIRQNVSSNKNSETEPGLESPLMKRGLQIAPLHNAYLF